MNLIKITLIQTELFWEDTVQNLSNFSDKLEDIKEETDIIVLPEMFSTGFTMNAEKCAEAENGRTMEWMKQKAKEKKAVIAGSLIIKEDIDKINPKFEIRNPKYNFYNRLFWVEPNGKYYKYDKRHLFRLGDEQLYYTQGKEKLITELKGWKFRPLVCYDLRFPVWSKNRLNKKNNTNDLRLTTYDYAYDCLIYVANWPLKRINAWRALLVSRAIENMSYVIGVNRIGNDGNGISHPGYSMAVDFKGNIIYECKPDTEVVETIQLSHKQLDDYRQHYGFALDWDNFTINSEQ